MNSRYRVQSASGSRGVAQTGDTYLLQQTIKQLQGQLLDTRAENQKIRDQLACLTSLVKRAWTGDTTAAQHVANIIGTAPPEIQQIRSGNLAENHFIVTAQPKSRVVNNWAKLTIGLLNREYCHLEREIEEEQRRHLLNRNAYLDGQIQQDYVRPAGQDRRDIVQKPPSTSFVTQIRAGTEQSRALSAKKPTMRHLYRPANQRADNISDHQRTFGDLTKDQTTQQEDCLLKKLSNGSGRRGSADTWNYSDYANPRRYSNGGLYDEESVVGPDAINRRQRPSSGTDQRTGDMARSRPKSAVLPKGERPLKYETTRPLSTKGRGMAPHTRTASTGDLYQGSKRPPSGKQWIKSHKSHTFITSEEHDQQGIPFDQQSHRMEDLEQQIKNGEYSDNEIWNSEDEDRERRRKAAQEIMVKIKKPESVVKYEEDLSRMGLMEEDFKSRTHMLQKKLGIPSIGMVGS